MSGRDGIYRYSMAVPEDPGSIPDGSLAGTDLPGDAHASGAATPTR